MKKTARRIAAARTGASVLRIRPEARVTRRARTTRTDGEDRHREQLAQGTKPGVHERRFRVGHHEGVGGAVEAARSVRAGHGILLDEERGRQEEDRDQRPARQDEPAVEPRGQPAGREREHDDEQQRLHQPGADPAEAVDDLVRSMRPGSGGTRGSRRPRAAGRSGCRASSARPRGRRRPARRS